MYIIYADIKSYYKKWNKKTVYVYAKNPGKSSTTKASEHNTCGYLMSTIWAFNYIENKPIIRKLYIAENVVWKTCVVLVDSCNNYA